jgi:hypothetical protein
MGAMIGMSVMIGLIATLIVMLLLIALAWAQLHVRALQYLFFLRFPVLLGSIGVALPVISSYGPLAGLLDNLYVLDHWFSALWLGVATTWLFAVVWLSGELIFRASDERFGIAFARRWPGEGDDEREWANDRWLDARIQPSRRRGATVAMFLIAALPMLIVLGLRSESPVICVSMALLGHVLVVAAMIWEGERRPLAAIGQRLRLERPRAFAKLLSRFVGARTSELLRGYDDVRGHQVALVLLGSTALFYGFGAFALRPWQTHWLAQHFPAIGYVLVLLTLIALVLPGLSLMLDLFRVPVLACLVAVLLPLQIAFHDHDHYFAAPERVAGEPIDPTLALAERFADDLEPVLVVVVASGGGGQAAVWTSRVFEGLASAGPWGERVLDSVGLVSTASGGSIGAMYWVDAYAPEGPPSDAATVDRLRHAAESGTLESVAWGIVYPDTLRVLAPVISQYAFPLLDRGRAMDRVWNLRFGSTEAPTLASWSTGVREGWRPQLIFNSTAMESGCRVLLGADPDSPDAFAGAIVFPSDEYDLEISTAARLSASFPYLSPAARAQVEVARAGTDHPLQARTCSDLDIGGQHLVDGGYYDNYGVVTAMQWLDHVLASETTPRFRKVVIVEIRSMSKQFERSEVALPGLVAQLGGPLITMMRVRSSSQIDRNDETLRQFAREWGAKGVSIRSVQFEARNEQRLSWSLTPNTIAAIRANWTDDSELVCQRRRLCELIGGRECPSTRETCVNHESGLRAR